MQPPPTDIDLLAHRYPKPRAAHRPNRCSVGTLIPVHDQSITAISKNHRRSVNTQIIICAHQRRVVVAGHRRPGNRNDVIMARQTVHLLDGRIVLGDDGHRGIASITTPRRDDTGRIIRENRYRAHRRNRARVAHIIARLKDRQVLHQYRRRGDAINHTRTSSPDSGTSRSAINYGSPLSRRRVRAPATRTLAWPCAMSLRRCQAAGPRRVPAVPKHRAREGNSRSRRDRSAQAPGSTTPRAGLEWTYSPRRRPRRPVLPPIEFCASADKPRQPGRQVRHQSAVGVNAFLDVSQIAPLDNAVQPFRAAYQHP